MKILFSKVLTDDERFDLFYNFGVPGELLLILDENADHFVGTLTKAKTNIGVVGIKPDHWVMKAVFRFHEDEPERTFRTWHNLQSLNKQLEGIEPGETFSVRQGVKGSFVLQSADQAAEAHR